MPLKVLLCSPPVFDFYYSFHRSEPLGLLYIKAMLKQYTWLDVDIYDARLKAKSKKLQTPDVFQYLHHIYIHDTSWFSLFYGYKRFGASFDRIAGLINEKKYDVVCISSLFTAYHHDVELLVKKMKEHSSAIVIVGGWAVWSMPTDEKGYADVYVKGDGEVVLPELLHDIYTSHNGCFHKLPEIIESSNDRVNEFFCNKIPERCGWYTYYGKRIANVICSKGCIHQCAFCSIHSRYTYQHRTFQSIEEEFHYLYTNGVQIINFEDDNFLYARDYALQLLSLMKHYKKKGMNYLCMNGITASNLHAVLDDAIDSGFLEFNLSLVSANDAIARRYNRPQVKEMIQDIAFRCTGRVKVVVFVIAGLPGSSIDDCIQDIVLLAKLPVIIGFSPLYMIPGVPMFETMGLPDDMRLCRGSALYPFGNNATREDIASLWKLCRFINTMKYLPHNPDDIHLLQEHIYYYTRACREKRWYYKSSDGTWQQGFSFHASLPEHIHVCDIDGNSREM